MSTLINKFIFGILFLFIAWKGLDGLLINYYSRQPLEADIQELEASGTKDNRFLKIKNAIAVGTFIYTEEDNGSSIDVIYPVISAQQVAKVRAGETAEARLLVKLKGMSRECLEDGTCFLTDSTTVSGLTENELLNFNREEYQMLEADDIKIAKDAVLVELGEEPIGSEWNFLMLLGGGIFALTILKSFFRKAKNLEDYWEKITEEKVA